MDELILLPEDQAIRAFFDDLDRIVLLRLLIVVAGFSVISIIALLVEGLPLWLIAPGVALVLVRTMFSASRHRFFERHFRPILLGYLLLHLAGFRLLALLKWPDVYLGFDYFLPLVLIFFCLRQLHCFLLLVPLWGFSGGRDLVSALLGISTVEVLPLIAVSSVCAAVFFWVGRQTQKRRRDFLLVWRREHQRHRERHRMQGELDEARRIQLSMLPRSDPSHRFFDIAGISIPASEVGGDYYEYFQSHDDSQAVVIADVAGHGVASGLLLAGVRSCLYLLKDSAHRPGRCWRNWIESSAKPPAGANSSPCSTLSSIPSVARSPWRPRGTLPS